MATNTRKSISKTTTGTAQLAVEPSTDQAAAPAKTGRTKAAPKAESAAKETAATAPAKKSRNKAPEKHTVSPEQRYRMIATAAYYLAERRGFNGDYDMQDWISAEAEIDAMLKTKD
ncbi:MAG: DUF2934 domain-containing protein [Pseudomonadota bacterium]